MTPLGHVNYPHDPGYLWDCPACELGPCRCEGHLELAPCVSRNCTQQQQQEEMH